MANGKSTVGIDIPAQEIKVGENLPAPKELKVGKVAFAANLHPTRPSLPPKAAPKATAPAHPVAAKPASSTVKGSAVKAKATPKPAARNLSLIARTAMIMGASEALPPSSIEDCDTDELETGFFHVMLYGPPDSFKTTTAGMFMGPEATRFVVTRRKEQMIPLAGEGFKFKVAHDGEALRYLLLYPEKVFGEAWANHPNRTLVIDDCTEGTDILVNDHKAYINSKGELVQVKDVRRAYKGAGDELHDLLKINLAKPQHVVLTAVPREFETEGTIDFNIEPDLPKKMGTLVKTELEFVFYMEPGENGKMFTRARSVVRTSTEKNPVTHQPDVWREITFAKQKFPLSLLGQKILLDKEEKNLGDVWRRISAALHGEIIPAPQPQGKTGAGTKK